MSELTVSTRAGLFRADLDGSDISNAIWLSLPLELTTNMLGGMMYCECPLSAVMPKEGRVTELEVGDIAYWPGPGALCFFFGPTPLSGEDGRPVAPYPVIRIGRLDGDCSAMEGAGDRQRIVLRHTFRRRSRPAWDLVRRRPRMDRGGAGDLLSTSFLVVPAQDVPSSAPQHMLNICY